MATTTMSPVQLTDLITSIHAGREDANLDAMLAAIRDRRDRLKEQAGYNLLNQLRVGQHVWFNGKVRPHYLAGEEVEIVKINYKKIVVRSINGSVGRFRGEFTTPVDLIQTTKY